MTTIWEKNAQIPDAKTVVFLGDSITADGTYVAYMDAYFRQHMPQKKLNFINLGVSSETVSGLSEKEHPFARPCVHDRLERALRESRPDWVVLGYGMNDGIYAPFDEDRFQVYQKGLLKAIESVQQAAAKAIVMTPPPFDAAMQDALLPECSEDYSYLQPYEKYDEVLQRYAQWILSLGSTADQVVDIYTPLLEHIQENRRRFPEYRSGDGIHPNRAGHWVMAKALLNRLFHIVLELQPDFVNNPTASPFFSLVMNRHRLLSAAWREHIGHTNPNKTDALCLKEALAQAEVLEERIRSLTDDQENQVAVRVSNWKGYVRHDFMLDGREGILVFPDRAAKGRPWVWRTEFFDAFAQVDMSLLEQGWALAYYRLSNQYGCPGAVERMRKFYCYVTEKADFAEKAAMFGFSRGGLYAFHYAAAYSDDVRLLYLDAPVLDIRSWPGGKGKGKGASEEWEACKAVYGITEKDLHRCDELLLEHIESVARANIPILIVAGDADEVVPFEENAGMLARRCLELRGNISMIVKPGVGHHPHSLEEPIPILDWIHKN